MRLLLAFFVAAGATSRAERRLLLFLRARPKIPEAWPTPSTDTKLRPFTRHGRRKVSRDTHLRTGRPIKFSVDCALLDCVIQDIFARYHAAGGDPSRTLAGTWSKLTRFGSSELINFQSRRPVLVIKLPLLLLRDRGWSRPTNYGKLPYVWREIRRLSKAHHVSSRETFQREVSRKLPAAH